MCVLSCLLKLVSGLSFGRIGYMQVYQPGSFPGF